MAADFGHFVREMPGKRRCDFTPLFLDGEAFRSLVTALASPFETLGVTKVAALDAMGFALGGAVAASLGAGLVLLRKTGKIPWKVETVYFEDYTGLSKSLEIAVDAIATGDRVLIVDDWSETGSQLAAAVGLVERMGGQVVGISVIDADEAVRQHMALAHLNLHRAVAFQIKGARSGNHEATERR